MFHLCKIKSKKHRRNQLWDCFLLVDVREPDEYAQGHVPGSVNLPLSRIRSAEDVLTDYDAPLFVYCLSGGRSGQAVSTLTRMGYTAVTNIGGISSYHGEVVK